MPPVARDLSPPPRRAPGDPERRRARATLGIYLGGLGLILLVVLWSSRAVLFQPWTARDWVTGATAEGSLYLIGGRSAAGALYLDIWRLDPARCGAAAAAVGGRILIAGGLAGKQLVDEIAALETDTGQVRSLGTLPAGLAFAGAAAVDGTVYIVGGFAGGHTTDIILSVDPVTGRVNAAGRLPQPIEQAAVAASAGHLYVVGGLGSAGDSLDTVLEIDPRGPEGPRVVRSAHLDTPRSRGAAVPVARGLLILGGWAGREMDDAWLLDTRGPDLELEAVRSLPRGMSDFVALAGDGTVYLVGGQDGELSRQIGVTAWDPETGVSQRVRLRGFLGF